jgi:hypothetical protein
MSQPLRLARLQEITTRLPDGKWQDWPTAVDFRKGNRMSIKNKVLAAAATLTAVGGACAAGALPASAATPQCSAAHNNACVQVFSAKYYTSPTSLGFVETVLLGIPLRGVPTIVSPASNSNPAEDLIIPLGGMVSDLAAKGMVSAEVADHYGTDTGVQLEYAPYGKPTGLCTAVAATAYQDEVLTLQPCSTPGTTVWILDFADAAMPGRFAIINGSDTDYVHPFAMTILGNPADQLITPIILQHLTGNPGSVPANQLWGSSKS